MSTDLIDALIGRSIDQVARSDRNATVLRWLANLVLFVGVALGAATFVVALVEDVEPAPSIAVAVAFALNGIVGWAVLAGLSNLVANGARALELQSLHATIEFDDDE